MMKLVVCYFSLFSFVHFICLFLCHTTSTCDANHTQDIASGSGELPIDPLPTTLDPTTTTIPAASTTQNLLVPFSTDVDAPPPSASVYVLPPSLSLSPSIESLPTNVFGILTTPLSPLETRSVSSSATVTLPPPAPPPLSLISYIINFSRTIVINQLQLPSVLHTISESLAEALALETTDVHNVNILTISERRKRQSLQGQLISFSAIEFSVSEDYVSSVEVLMRKIRNGDIIEVQLFPNETVEVKEIMRSSADSPTESGTSLSTGQLAGLVVGGLTGLLVLLLLVASVIGIVVKTRRSSESQEIANLRHTYGYQYTSHSTSQWPPRSPLL